MDVVMIIKEVSGEWGGGNEFKVWAEGAAWWHGVSVGLASATEGGEVVWGVWK